MEDLITQQITMTLLVGGAVASLAWVIISMATAPRVVDPALGRFEEARRDQLRRVSAIYRFAEPWVDELVGVARCAMSGSIRRLRDDLPATGDRTPWHPEEYLATKLAEGAILTAASLPVTLYLTDMQHAALASLGTGALYVFLGLGNVSGRAKLRRKLIRRRFTSTFDLVSLMLAVGASFHEAIATVAEESNGHPLGQELERMLQDTDMGRMRGETLRAFSDRLADEDISEMMTGVIEAEELGTPIAEVMHTQVEQMRQKRTQWAEKESEESKVKLVFPGMVIMIACLVIVAAPFVLDAVVVR
ncbi:type II secretion system F family protein [Pirellulales bacterium]|nr:type II secretion system F family protein [Pirellulales bacterium]